MATLTFERELTALLVVDPYNDFISEGGKIWDRIKGVAEANNCVPNMLRILDLARKAGLRVFYHSQAHYCWAHRAHLYRSNRSFCRRAGLRRDDRTRRHRGLLRSRNARRSRSEYPELRQCCSEYGCDCRCTVFAKLRKENAKWHPRKMF